MAVTTVKVDEDVLELARIALDLGDGVAASIIVRKALYKSMGRDDLNPIKRMGRPPKNPRSVRP